MAQTKDDRLQIRVDPTSKRLIEQGAAASHLSVSAFVLQAAALHAEQLLAERELLRLPANAAEAFSAGLEQPGVVNQELLQALTRPRKFDWLG